MSRLKERLPGELSLQGPDGALLRKANLQVPWGALGPLSPAIRPLDPVLRTLSHQRWAVKLWPGRHAPSRPIPVARAGGHTCITPAVPSSPLKTDVVIWAFEGTLYARSLQSNGGHLEQINGKCIE